MGFQEKTQLIDCIGHSWSMFSRDTDSYIPEDKSHENTATKLTFEEKEKIRELREWLRSESFNETIFERGPVYIPGQVGTSSSSTIKQSNKFNKFADYPITLSAIENNLYFNLVARVIAFRRKSDCSVLRCIDGTKPTIQTFKNNSLYMETHFNQLVMAQLFDYAIDITVYDEHALVTEVVKVGSYVEFNNLHCYIPSSSEVCEVILHKGHMFNRGMRLLPSNHDSIPAVQERIDMIKVSYTSDWTLPALPPDDATSTTPITVLSNPNLPLISIRDLLLKHAGTSNPSSSNSSSRPSSLYRIRVFVDSFTPENFPSFIRKFCQPCRSFSTTGECGKCGMECLQRELFYKLQVRDQGQESEVKCYAQDARAFLRIEDGEAFTMGRLEEIERVMGRWCDLSVFYVRGVLVLKGCSIVGSQE